MSAAEDLFEQLLGLGVTHAVGLPDSVTAPVIARFESHEGTRWVPVSREGEAFALAAGLWVGGARPVVIIQNTGLLESGDAIRGVAMRMGVPLLCLVTYRGWGGARKAGWAPGSALDRDWLVRPDVDSTALFTEPTLRAWEVPYVVGDAPLGIEAMWARAHQERRPTAVLLGAAGGDS